MYQWFKGILERFLSLLAIVVLSPLLALIALIVITDSPGPAVFRQERVGKDGIKFTLYKFRTMYIENDDAKYKAFLQKFVNENVKTRLGENGEDIYNLVNDPRVTRFGKLLRWISLDELPQLFNILKGEMSFIGPRPDIPYAVDMYKPRHRNRLSVKPGITGLWQISGRRNCSFEDMVKLDVEYIKKQSLLMDAKILILTVREILCRDVQSV